MLNAKFLKSAEFNKGLLLLSAGYVFCYMFLIDYSQESMSIFHRYSTISFTIYQHPFLFALWCALCASTFFQNIDFLRHKYHCPQKYLFVLQCLGLAFLVLTLAIPVRYDPHETFGQYLQYYAHLFSALAYALCNLTCLMCVFVIKMKQDRRFKRWLAGVILLISVILGGFLFNVFEFCGFIETAPTLIIMGLLYVLNFTKAMDKKAPSENRLVLEGSLGV